MENYDFSGWATRANIRCADGRTIMKDAFKDCDGKTVPLCWGHNHSDPYRVLGHALLENRDGDIYTYGKFNDTESGQNAKMLVEHGDVVALSIYANNLKQSGGNVLHGAIREVSLVLAGANPGAFIDSVIAHGEESSEEAIIYTGEDICLSHSAETAPREDKSMENEKKKTAEDEETVGDVFNSLTEKQKTVVYAMIGQALEEAGVGGDEQKEENMKHNIFDSDAQSNQPVLSHADEEAILNLAKSSSVGSLQTALEIYSEDNAALAHSFDDIDYLFPDYKDVKPGAPDLITRDQGWVTAVMNGVHKSPISRIRTRQTDIRDTDSTRNLRGRGYNRSKNNGQKVAAGNAKLLKRTTDPQTVYRKDALHRDDIIDITDFDVVEYEYGIMRQNLNEEIATAIMIGDGRNDGDDHKISEDHIRSIWHDDDLYTIHADVDIAAMRNSLQGTGTSANFGDNYIYAEAIIQAALYAREYYKGSGRVDFYCTPHLLNVMLLARDMNGRRIYSDKSDLAKALNVGTIYTAEQFEGKTRIAGTGASAKTKKLLGIFVDLNDYTVGSAKGGEITRFQQFDIDFNQEKFLLEARISGAATKVYSAIALEEDVTPSTTTNDEEESPT